MDLQSKLNELKSLIANAETDLVKFVKGNKAAGTRVRKAMQDLKTGAQEIRVGVQDAKNEAAE